MEWLQETLNVLRSYDTVMRLYTAYAILWILVGSLITFATYMTCRD